MRCPLSLWFNQISSRIDFSKRLAASSLRNSLFLHLLAIGRLCEKCDGKCVICDSYVRPCTLVRICDECNYGSYQGRCVICGGPGVSDAYYCKECTIQEKDVSEVYVPRLRIKLIWYTFDLICFILTISDYFLHFQRDGCPKIVNLGSSKTDLFYERKKYGFKQRWSNSLASDILLINRSTFILRMFALTWSKMAVIGF